MTKKTQTMKVGQADYAKVVDRIKVFREDCPKGSIETNPTILPDGQIMFTATITKDLSNPASAKATGNAIGPNKGVKAFEKIETISVGRALAFLGYMASGEIASSEEMEEFNAYLNEKKEIAIATLKAVKSLDELKEVFMSLGSLMANPEIIKVKDELKATLK